MPDKSLTKRPRNALVASSVKSQHTDCTVVCHDFIFVDNDLVTAQQQTLSEIIANYSDNEEKHSNDNDDMPPMPS